MNHAPPNQVGMLLPLLLAYAAATLFHHVHNAAFIGEYPNLPNWLSRAQVYGAWLGVTSVGALGYVLMRLRHLIAGLAVLACYALFGLDGLGHYAVAPVSAHTFTMNLTIWLEVVTAALLLTAITAVALRRVRERPA